MMDEIAANRMVRERLSEAGVEIRVTHAATAAFLRTNHLARDGDAVHVASPLRGDMSVPTAVRLWLASSDGARYLPDPQRGYRRLIQPRLALVHPE
jgi:hypothetical protein